MQSQQKMGTMRMGPLIFSMALPAMISMLINALYNIVDSIFVARYSASALTAVSLVFPLQQLVIAIGVGTGVGVNSLIARSLGARDQEKANDAAEHGLVLSIVGGVVFILLGFLCSRPFLAGFTENSAVLEQAVSYSHIAVGLSIFVMVSLMCEKIQQSTGNMIIPMCQGLTGAIVNIILDPLLIFGIGPFPEMGIRGAAIATVAGQVIGMLIGLWGVFVHQKVLTLRMRGWKPKLRMLGAIYQVGLPGIIMQSLSSVLTAGMNAILIQFSETAVTVLGIYFKLQTFIFMPVFGLNQGALPVMGYNFGARNRGRLMGAYRIALISALVILGVGAVIFQVFPAQMIMLFTPADDAAATADMMQIGIPALRIISLSFIAAAFGIINSTVFQAIGHGLASLVVSFCRQLCIILPAAAILGHFFGLGATWYAFPIAEYIAVVISYAVLGRIYRREIKDLAPRA